MGAKDYFRPIQGEIDGFFSGNVVQSWYRPETKRKSVNTPEKNGGFQMENYRFTFNMGQIGRKISQLRKERNMTQMELADKLGISFQAVSNWERGNTMPDIGKLPELAGIFQVTTDEILGESSGLVNSAIKGEMEKYMEENQVTVQEFAQAAPLLTPVQAEAGVEKLTDEKPLPKLSEIQDILPFVGSDLVDELALKYADSPEWKSLGEIAPFMSSHALDEIAQKRAAQGRSIDDFAPFLSAQRIEECAFAYEAASEWSCLEDILPFLGRQALEQIVDRQAEAGEYGFIEDCLPFLAQETVVRLAMDVYEKKGTRGAADFFPFLSQNARQDIARKAYEERGLRNLEDIAPFLDRGYLNGLAQEALEKEGIQAIAPIAPFLDADMLKRCIREKYL